MLEDIVRFVVTLLVPATKEPAIAGMLRNFTLVCRGCRALQFLHELRNPLAFSHPAFSLLLSEMRGKPACANFLEGEYLHSRRRSAE